MRQHLHAVTCTWLLTFVLITSAIGPQCCSAQATKQKGAQIDERTGIKREDLRYDGKSFQEWRRYLLTELKPERRQEALAALATLGMHGYGKEAATVIAESVKSYDVSGTPDGKEWAVLEAAEAALKKIGPAAIAVLQDALQAHANAEVRYFALTRLVGRYDEGLLPSGSEQMFSVLITGILDKNRELRNAALSHLWWRELLKKTQQTFLSALEKHAAKNRLVPALRRALADKDSYARLNAVGVLGRLGKRAHPAVASILEHLKDDEVQNVAFNALVRLKVAKQRLIPPLIAILENDAASQEQISFALSSLATLGPAAKSAIPALTKGFEKTASANRKEILIALSKIDTDGVTVPLFRKILHSTTSTESDQIYAVRALGEMRAKGHAAVPDLVKIIENNKDQSFRFEAALALGKMEKESELVMPILIAGVWHFNSYHWYIFDDPATVVFYTNAIRQLGKYGAQAKSAVPALVRLCEKCYKHDSPKTLHITVIQTLGQIGPDAKTAIPILKRALASDHAKVRRAAVRAITRIAEDEK